MVKLASAREIRLYGPRLTRKRSEYMNAGLYVFSTVVLFSGFVALFSSQPQSALVVLLIAFALVMLVNLHDLLAHLAGIDYHLQLMEFDVQLALVEFAVPVVQIMGCVLFFIGILFIFFEEETGFAHSYKLERHALNLLIAGSALWLIGSFHNSCQIYERSDGHVQILQESVQIPFLMGSLLFLIGAVINRLHQSDRSHHGVELLSGTWVWFGIFGSVLLFTGGLANVVKVFKMQQMDGLRLEKLRGGAQERLIREREGQVSLIGEEHRRRKIQMPEPILPVTTATPYKDVLLSKS
ncbi:hypothetical protein Ancab_009889 [Ancistrocladus abbreviatus]